MNFDPEIVKEIANRLGMNYAPTSPNDKMSLREGEADEAIQKGKQAGLPRSPVGSLAMTDSKQLPHSSNDDLAMAASFSELDIFDYIYGVLHCPAYRETYKEFLKVDFPRIPYPSSPAMFWDISAKAHNCANCI